MPDGTKVSKSKQYEDRNNDGESRSTLNDLKIPDECGCDINTRTVLCPVTSTENTQRKKK